MGEHYKDWSKEKKEFVQSRRGFERYDFWRKHPELQSTFKSRASFTRNMKLPFMGFMIGVGLAFLYIGGEKIGLLPRFHGDAASDAKFKRIHDRRKERHAAHAHKEDEHF